MPFQSDKQRRYLWANEPEIAREWTDRYGARGGGIMRIPLANGSLRGHPLYGTERPQSFNKQHQYTGNISSPAEREAINQINKSYLPYMEERVEKESTGQIPYNTGEFDWIDMGKGAEIFPRTEPGSDLSNQMYKDAYGWGAEPDKIKAMRQDLRSVPRPLGFDTSYGVANEADVTQKPLTQESKAPYSIKDQLKRDFLDPFKKAVETVLPGGEPGYVKGGLYRNIGSTIGKPILGITSLLGKMVDKFDQLPEVDQMYISQQMGGAGQMGEGIYRDPQSGLLKDKGGKNVRSLRGNYAEAVYKEANRYDTTLERTKKAHLDKYGSLDAVNKYGKTWAEMNKRNLEMSRYYNDKKIKQKKFVSNYLQSQKVQKQKAGEIIAKEKAKKIVPSGDGGDYSPSKYYNPTTQQYQSPAQHKAEKSFEIKSGPLAGQTGYRGGRARGGRASYFNGGLASLWPR